LFRIADCNISTAEVAAFVQDFAYASSTDAEGVSDSILCFTKEVSLPDFDSVVES
jgi:hypothetical protein